MNSTETVMLTRDCEAMMVPSGAKVTLQKGEQATITQTLGGNYTVVVRGNMFQIFAKDADAIGKQAAAPSQPAPQAGGPLDEKLLWAQLKTCYDPEIPVNIVELGLVYDCKVTPLPDNSNRVDVKMTLTAVGCGMGPSIAGDVQQKLLAVSGVTEANVEIVWDPPWNQMMMSEAAKLQLGLM